MTSGNSDAGQEPAWLHSHEHEPNPAPPSPDPALVINRPDGTQQVVTPDDLDQLPQITVPDCYIVSTGHGTSGPFIFHGVQLLDVITAYLPSDAVWRQADVVSADGFGNRVLAEEMRRPIPGRPIVLATQIDGRPLTREEGLVRLIVPTETDDALRQVKWVAQIDIR